MNSCSPFHFDFGGCGGGIADFLSGWVWGLPVWGICIVVLLILGVAYRFGGLPGVVAAAGGLGVLAGRHSAAVEGKDRGGGYMLTPKDARAVQRALAARHLYPGPIDGILGTQSQAGIRALQRNLHPPETETGTLTPRVRKALGLKF